MDGSNPFKAERWRALSWIVAVVLMAAALVVLRLAIGGGAHAQVVGWPTPPPGPPFVPPSAESVEAPITGAVDPQDGEVRIVRPSWPGATPIIPPVPAERVTFGGEATGGPPVTFRIDAGTFNEVVQLRVTPATAAGALKPGTSVIWAFELEAFDRSGKRLETPFQRPVKLTAPAASFMASGIKGDEVVFAMLDGDRSGPIVTTFGAASQLLIVRLVSAGTVALLAVGR